MVQISGNAATLEDLEGLVTAAELATALAAKAEEHHGHVIADVQDLDRKLTDLAQAVSLATGDVDVSGFVTNETLAAALAAKAAFTHAHGVGSITGLADALAAKADASSISNLDNTSDANKPISIAVEAALNDKAASAHPHEISAITGLSDALSALSAGGTNRVLVTDDHTAVAEQFVMVDTTSKAITVTAPENPVPNTYFYVADASRNAATNHITIDLNGAGENLIINVNNLGVGFIFNGTSWGVFI